MKTPYSLKEGFESSNIVGLTGIMIPARFLMKTTLLLQKCIIYPILLARYF